jgi:serine/threonine protein kinase
MTEHNGWEIIEKLGEGGQSTVYLARNPDRVAERERCLLTIRESLDRDNRPELSKAIYSYARPDLPTELGALKVFKIQSFLVVKIGENNEANQRLRNEILALGQGRNGLPKLLAASEKAHWIVTELFPQGTLEKHLEKYKGTVVPAMRAFRSLVATVASLHAAGFVHRDIKPANVFVRTDDQLVLGDFGIVFVPDVADRVTLTNERVGPRDYMPQWGDLGERLDNVPSNFDVYMLGKLLWCMISGRLKLPREYHRRPAFDLEMMFPGDREMALVNAILDKCLVEEPHECLTSAQELLEIVDKNLATLLQGVPLLDEEGKLARPCRVCGKGFYRNHLKGVSVRLQGFDNQNRPTTNISLAAFVCDVCTHFEFFTPNFPEEAAQKGWKPWLPQKS